MGAKFLEGGGDWVFSGGHICNLQVRLVILASLLAGLGIFMLRLEWLVSMYILLHGGHIIILQVRLVILASLLAGLGIFLLRLLGWLSMFTVHVILFQGGNIIILQSIVGHTTVGHTILVYNMVGHRGVRVHLIVVSSKHSH